MRHALACLGELDAALCRAPQLLVATDFDGTLCPIANSPAGLTIPPATREILQQLTLAGRVTLAVISGRSLKDLAAKVPVPAILGGNHGFEISGPDIGWQAEPLQHPAFGVLSRAGQHLERAAQSGQAHQHANAMVVLQGVPPECVQTVLPVGLPVGLMHVKIGGAGLTDLVRDSLPPRQPGMSLRVSVQHIDEQG
jgi:hypothetical protein